MGGHFLFKKLTDLISLRTLQKIQENFANALEIELNITDLKGKLLTRRNNLKEFCRNFTWGNPKFSHLCNQEIVKAGQKVVEHNYQSYIYRCHAGLWSFCAPIMVEGRVIALLNGGQTRLENPDLKECQKEAERLGVDFDRYLECYFALPLVTKERLEAMANLGQLICNTISALAASGLGAQNKVDEMIQLNELLEQEVKRKTEALEKSEEKYRGLIENASDIIYTIDNKGILTSINTAAERLLGFKKEEILGFNFPKFIHPDDLEKVVQSFNEVASGKRKGTRGLEFRLLMKNGGSKMFELNSNGFYDQEGKLIRIEGFLRNIDETARLERQLGTVKQQHQGLFDCIKDGVYLANAEGEMVTINRAGLEIFGYRNLNEIIGKKITDFYVYPLERGKFLAEIEKKGFVKNHKVYLKKKNGTPFWISVDSFLIKDRQGRVLGVEGVFYQTTDLIKFEKMESERGQRAIKTRTPLVKKRVAKI